MFVSGCDKCLASANTLVNIQALYVQSGYKHDNWQLDFQLETCNKELSYLANFLVGGELFGNKSQVYSFISKGNTANLSTVL